MAGATPFGIDAEQTKSIALSIRALLTKGIEVAIVIGGGNIFRGENTKDLSLERSSADHMGMLATIMNGIALSQAINAIGRDARVLSAVECPRFAETYTWRAANDYMSKGKVVIFVGGTGNPYFTTDTAAALRASEMGADILLKATKVDGIYNKDPIQHADAVRYEQISFGQILTENLQVMDASAIALCRTNNIPILVFNLFDERPLYEVLEKQIGTLVQRKQDLLHNNPEKTDDEKRN